MTEKEELLKWADEIWKKPTYNGLLDLVSALVKYIKKEN